MIHPTDSEVRRPQAVRDGHGAPVTCATCGCRLRAGMADNDIAPHLHRMDALGVLALWRGQFPAVEDWFARIKARPAFKAAILDWEAAEDLELMARSAQAATPLLIQRLSQQGHYAVLPR